MPDDAALSFAVFDTAGVLDDLSDIALDMTEVAPFHRRVCEIARHPARRHADLWRGRGPAR